jgi:3-hydroxyacyl-[acyl-carrier-protein] dehydratase
MAEANYLTPKSCPEISRTEAPPEGDDDAQLQEMLKHCAPSTYEAARDFRATRRLEFLPTIVLGVMARYVDPELRTQLRAANDELRLRDDLGLDSLSLMEIVIRLEDVLQISVRDDDLRQFRTLGEVRALIERTFDSESGSSGAPVRSS